MPDIYIAKDKKGKPTQAVQKTTSSPTLATEAPIENSPSPAGINYEDELKRQLAEEIDQITPSGEPRPTNRLLSSFAFFPPSANFETQSHEEKIILLLRRHPVTNIPWLLLAILLLIAPTFLRFLTLPPILPANYQLIAVLVWYLLTLAFIFENFLSWYFNVNIITDERIVDFDFYSLIYKDISDAKIEDIQETRVIVGGVVRTLLNFGTVFIQTAAEHPNFEFTDIPNPEQVSKILDKLRLVEEQEALEGRAR